MYDPNELADEEEVFAANAGLLMLESRLKQMREEGMGRCVMSASINPEILSDYLFTNDPDFSTMIVEFQPPKIAAVGHTAELNLARHSGLY